jgi:Hydrolases of the alpha/beta superfamily
LAILKSILFIAIGVYVIGAALLYFFQRNLLYFPSPEYQHDLATLEVINDDQTLKIAVMNPGQARAIIYFGGNAEPVVFNEVPFAEHFPSHTVYLVSYRGYGGSSGEPTELGLFSDALAIYDFVQSEHESVSAVGRSLGSGVAIYLASERAIDALGLVTPYDSIVSVARKRFPFYPVSLLLLDKYDSAMRVPKVSAKVLIVMAELDKIIPNWHSVKLQDAFPTEQVRVLKIAGADHNNVSANADYFPALKAFFESN